MVTAWIAAMPEANASAPQPPSIDANVVCSEVRVGLPLLE
jgi:hypothetical protein